MVTEAIKGLLAYRWKTDVEMFDRVKGLDGGDRWHGVPCVYTYGRSLDGEGENCGLTAVEAHAIHKQEGFGEHSYLSARDGELCVNEHAAHALMSFFAEVTVAWDKYQKRLETIPAGKEQVGR